MQRIAELTLETVSLHARYQFERICVEVIDGRFPVRRMVPLGETLPLWTGPSGKVILAFLSEAHARAVLSEAATAGQDLVKIRDQLAHVHNNGYLATVSDRNAGVGGLSVPIFDVTGVAASVTVSGPEERWDLTRMVDLAPAIVEACKNLSRSLGHLPSVGL